MSRKFFEITDEIVAVKTDLFASEEEQEQRLEILLNELSTKEDGVWHFYKSLQQDIDLADEYIEKIKGEKKKRQNTQKSLKGMVIDAYQQTEALPKYSTFNPLKILSSASVDVIDENKIPKEYWKEKVVYVLDKKKMLEHLKKGKTIAGADLKRSPYVKGLK